MRKKIIFVLSRPELRAAGAAHGRIGIRGVPPGAAAAGGLPGHGGGYPGPPPWKPPRTTPPCSSALSLNRRVTLVDTEGNVVFDNYAGAASMENHGDREEIQLARANGSATVTRTSNTLSEEMVYHTRLLSDGEVLRLAASQRTLWGLLTDFLPWAVLVLVACVVLAVLLSARATRTLVAPIAAIDPEHPLDNECYEELTPLLRKLHAQQEENARQLATLKTQKDEQDALLAHMREGLVVLDGRQRIVTMNGAAQAILDAPRQAPRGRNITGDQPQHGVAGGAARPGAAGRRPCRHGRLRTALSRERQPHRQGRGRAAAAAGRHRGLRG